MILFVAPNPKKEEKREGFLQRINAIDDLFKTQEKFYYEDIKDTDKLSEIVLKADLIYVHSIHYAKLILPYYQHYADKIVTDLHGLVPEEAAYLNKSDESRDLNKAEADVFSNSQYFVAVSKVMKEFYIKKYKLNEKTTKWIVLPIFESKKSKNLGVKKIPNVVYAGGSQRWQNVDKMIDAINLCEENYTYSILTHDTSSFSEIKESVRPRVVVKTVPSSQISKYLERASLGFVLRDDLPLNRVACPTKIIEYLSNGVVPVVLSPYIGDLKELGYGYITLNDFINNPYDQQSLKLIVEKNNNVMIELERQSKDGKENLKHLLAKLTMENETKKKRASEIELVATLTTIIRLREVIEKLKYEINTRDSKIKELEKNVEELNKQLYDTLNSKRWLMTEKLLAPKNIIKQTFSSQSKKG